MSAYRVIGRSMPRAEAWDKLTGRARYVADVSLSRMVYARPILSPHAHARVLAIDGSAAAAVPGVLGVFTDADLGGRGLLAGDEVCYAGEPVAVVVADAEAVAEDAAERVQVVYEPLPAVLDAEAARRPEAPAVRLGDRRDGLDDAGAHGAAAAGTASISTGPPTHPVNVSRAAQFARGNLAAGWSQADVVVEDVYRIARVHQGYLETQGSLASFEQAQRGTIWTSTQGMFAARRETAGRLGIAEQKLRLVPCVVGGGFGGKLLLLEPLAAQLARRIGRPVRIVLDRVQDFLLSRPGPGACIRLRLGARRNGTLTALQAELLFDSGAEPGAPGGIASLLLGGAYRVPNLDVRYQEVLTNKTPVGAYRAPGAPQAFFALESLLDELARKLGVDPLDLRRRNAAVAGDELPDGSRWPRIGFLECLDRLSDHPMWRSRQRGEDEGWGLAAGAWNGGTEPAAAACRLDTDGSLTVQVGSVDITGTHTGIGMIAAEVLGLPAERVEVVAGDTENAPQAGQSGGSKITYTVGLAVLRAAEDARRQLLAVAAEELEAAVEDLALEDGRVYVRGAPGHGLDVAEVARLASRFGGRHAPIFGQGRVALPERAPGFAVHLVKVHVDRETGRVEPRAYLAIQDVGRAINPAEVVGQIRGGVVQGLGRALLERMEYEENGQLLDANLGDYLLPTAADVPDIAVELVEVPAPHGPFGARGVGEPPAVPGAAAVANAVADATGVRLRELPILPEALLRALRR